MKQTTEQVIMRKIESMEQYGLTGGRAADVWESIVKLAAKEYMEEMESMGNGYNDARKFLIEDIEDIEQEYSLH